MKISSQSDFFLLTHLCSAFMSVYPGPIMFIYPGLIMSIYPGLIMSIYPGPIMSIYPGLIMSIYPGLIMSIYPGPIMSIYPGPIMSIYPGPIMSIYPGPNMSIYPGPNMVMSDGFPLRLPMVVAPGFKMWTIRPFNWGSMFRLYIWGFFSFSSSFFFKLGSWKIKVWKLVNKFIWDHRKRPLILVHYFKHEFHLWKLEHFL